MNTVMDNNITVTVRDLEKKFGDFIAVNRISFDVNRGEIFGFLGPNGAGKSTTIRMLCGIMSPTRGSGYIGGYDINRQQELIKQNIGYMSQKFSLYDDLTVEENIDFYSGIYKIPKRERRERKEEIIQMVGIGEFRSMFSGTLAGGLKQRLALGCAIIHEPRIIFLDEPTAGVDPIARNNFWKLIKEMANKGVTIFVTTHYMDEAENCDRLALIYRGAIIAIDTPLRLKTQHMKEKVLKISVRDGEEWLHKFEKVEGIKELALFGTAIHAIVDNTVKATQIIKKLFREAGLKSYEIEQIQASLEDVFVSLIESYDKVGGTCELQKN
jgi:ABC-2 type transport system ATP-binding protein